MSYRESKFPDGLVSSIFICWGVRNLDTELSKNLFFDSRSQFKALFVQENVFLVISALVYRILIAILVGLWSVTSTDKKPQCVNTMVLDNFFVKVSRRGREYVRKQ